MIRQLVRVDRDWFPTVEGGSLYIRPFMFASEVFLGVKPSAEYLYIVIISPVGGYFKSGAPAVSIWVSQNYTRAAPGGTGAAKCGGNYAASLVAQAEASKHGCDQVVFLDAAEHKWVEELGGMNVFFVFEDGSLQTPPLSGTILPGITRDSLMTLARAEGLTVREEPYSIDQWREDAGERQAARGLRLRHRRRRHADRHREEPRRRVQDGLRRPRPDHDAPEAEARRHPARHRPRPARLGAPDRLNCSYFHRSS